MRALGVALILYGALGLLLVGAGSMVGAGGVARVERLSDNVEGSLAAAASTVQNTADSFDGFETSLTEAGGAARNAAHVVRESAVTMANLSTAMSITIFGTQPLQPLARDFERGAEQLSMLSRDLDRLALALSANIDDVSSIRDDLRVLGERLDGLTTGTGDAPAGGGLATGGLATGGLPLRLLFFGLLAWLALQALGALVAGVLVLRRASRPPAAVVVER
jgi:hypothetical protein